MYLSSHWKSASLNMQIYLPAFPNIELYKLYTNIKTPKYHQLAKEQVFPQCTIEMKIYQLHILNHFPSIET